MLLDVKEYVLDVKKCILHDFLTLISTQENLIFHSLHTISLKWDSQKSYYDEIRLYAKLNYAVRYEKLDFRCNWLVLDVKKCISHDFLTLISTQENLIDCSQHTISLK